MGRDYEQLEYRFTKDELEALGRQLAEEAQQVYKLRAERQAVGASLAAAIKEHEKAAAELSLKIVRKSELREVEIVFVMDRPRHGLKTIVRADNGEELRVAVMSLEEQQARLDFGDQGDDKAKR